MRSPLCFAVLLLALPVKAEAQSALISPMPSPLFTLARESIPRDAARPSPSETHWKSGAIAGGIVVGLFGAAAGEAVCEMSETAQSCLASMMGGALVGAVLGATVGALIGGQFPK